jgi:hypothetical protein
VMRWWCLVYVHKWEWIGEVVGEIDSGGVEWIKGGGFEEWTGAKSAHSRCGSKNDMDERERESR